MAVHRDHSDWPDIQSLWDYGDPAASEQRFREALRTSGEHDPGSHAELLTQIARTFSMRGRFHEAHAMLDDVERMRLYELPRAHIRCLLERGRTFNSAGERDKARPLFRAAWELAQQHGVDGFAVDAAHMIAIVSAPHDAIAWNNRAIDLATNSADPDAQRWMGSLCNNLGWAHHESGDFEDALRWFEQALDARVEQGVEDDVCVARWCVARCLRSLGRIDEALAIQADLAKRHADAGTSDGFVHEELAECLHALGRVDESRSHFQSALDQLSQDRWLMDHESERIARLKAMAEGAS